MVNVIVLPVTYETKKNVPLTLKLLKVILSRIVSKTCTGPILGVAIEVNLKIKQKKNPPPPPPP